MCKRVMIPLVMAFFATALLLSGCASLREQEELSAEIAGKGGDTVLLFHGGSREAKEVFCLKETVPAYRATWESNGSIAYKEVGKVKITAMRGEHYFYAQVVEGEAKDGDIVRKEGLGCLVRVPVEEKK